MRVEQANERVFQPVLRGVLSCLVCRIKKKTSEICIEIAGGVGREEAAAVNAYFLLYAATLCVGLR